MASLPPLGIIESRRLQALLDESIKKLNFLDAITPDALQHREDLSKFAGNEISRIIKEQRTLEQRYEALISQRAALKGSANKSKYKEARDEIRAISQALRTSTKHLCRNLQDNPNIAGNLLKVQRERQTVVRVLEETIAELAAKGSFAELAHSLQQDDNEQERMKALVQREREMSDTVKQLDSDVVEERINHRKRVADLTASISEKKQQLLTLKSRTCSDHKLLQLETHARACSAARLQHQESLRTQGYCEQLDSRTDVEQLVHQSTVDFLHLKNRHLLQQIEEWQRRHSSDCENLEAELQQLADERAVKLKRLDHLRERRNRELESERDARERIEIQNRIERRRVAEMRKKTAAAKLIQMKVRSFLCLKKESEANRQKR